MQSHGKNLTEITRVYLKQGPREGLSNYVGGRSHRMSTLVWPTGDGDADCQVQAEVFGQICSVWQCIMSTVRSCWECVTYDNLDSICFFGGFYFSIYSVYSFSCLLSINLANKADYYWLIFSSVTQPVNYWWIGVRVVRTSDLRFAVDGSPPGHDTAWLLLR